MWLPAITVTPPAAEPVTLPAAKTFLRLDGTALDDQIAAFIAGARAEIEAASATRLITQTVLLQASTFDDLDVLPIGPARELVEVRYLAADGAEQALDGCELFGAELRQGIRPAFGGAFPATRAVPDAVRIKLVVGYGDSGSDLPQDLRVALVRKVRGAHHDEPVDVEAALINHRIWL